MCPALRRARRPANDDPMSQRHQVLRTMGISVLKRGNPHADVVQFRGSELGVKAQRTEPVVPRQGDVASQLQGGPQAVVRASLLVRIANLAGQGQGHGVLGAGLVRPPGAGHDRADAIEGLSFTGPVATVAK